MSLLHAKRYLIPYVRPFPVLIYQEIHDFQTGIPTGEWAWLPDWFGQHEITREEAERLWEAHHA